MFALKLVLAVLVALSCIFIHSDVAHPQEGSNWQSGTQSQTRTLLGPSYDGALQRSNHQGAGEGDYTRSPSGGGTTTANAAPVNQHNLAALNRPNWVNHPLPTDHQEYVNRVLQYWQQTSAQVKRYQCQFTRWQYDPSSMNWRDPETGRLAARTIARGHIRYAEPDRGMYEVTELWHAVPPPPEGGKLDYRRGDEQEKWICDGQGIYEYDYATRVLYEMPLPPEMQGAGLKNSPLPFLFGAQADDLQQRFWIRVITPPNAPQDEYWLEAVPKRLEDARFYQRVEVILSREPFLPKSVHMYAPNYDARDNPTSTFFVFENREINGRLAAVQGFLDTFIRPSTPFGWRREERRVVAEDRSASFPAEYPSGFMADPPRR